MIIVCSGPDTYRAREKAREFVAAFRAKHDAQGFATERVDGGEGLAPLLGRLCSPSLFTIKRLVRADGCLAEMKIAEVRQLAVKLEADKDATIVLTVEDEAPAAKVLEVLGKAYFYHYNFPTQKGADFLATIREHAKNLGVDKQAAEKVAELADGDSWLAMQELAKLAAYPAATPAAVSTDSELFATVDAAIQETPCWRTKMAQCEDENLLNVLAAQMRSFMRVRDGRTEGVHPFVAKKLKNLRSAHPERRYLEVLRALFLSRSGLPSGRETETVL